MKTIEKTLPSQIEEAVQSGRISEERINKSVARIWAMKEEVGLLQGATQQPFSDLETIIGIPNHIQRANEIAEKSPIMRVGSTIILKMIILMHFV